MLLSLIEQLSNIAGKVLELFLPIKVSATLQDRPRADGCSVSCFYKNPYKPYIF